MANDKATDGRKAKEHLRLTERNKWRLRRLKTGGDSFDDVLGKLLDAAEDDLKPDFDEKSEELESDGDSVSA